MGQHSGSVFVKLETAKTIPDFFGSGSSLVEGLLAGLNVIGTDINPLAKLISDAKLNIL